MASKRQLAIQAATRGYTNRACRVYHFKDPDRQKAAHARRAVPKDSDDPCAIVPCPYCQESVVAMGKHYHDAVWGEAILASTRETVIATKFVPHRHQPEGNPKYKLAAGECSP